MTKRITVPLLVVVFAGLVLGFLNRPTVCPLGSRLITRNVAHNAIDDLLKALRGFREDTGRFPDENEGLKALRSAPANNKGWNGPYYHRAIPRDPWDRPYVYRVWHGSRDVRELGTFGADGKPGGDDLDQDIFAKVL